MWVYPLISQRLLKDQFQKLHEDLCAYPQHPNPPTPNILLFNIQFLCDNIALFTTFSHRENRKKLVG
jgi:hypothetical protein